MNESQAQQPHDPESSVGPGEADPARSDQNVQGPWTSVAPLVAWWWLVMALTVALILGFGFLHSVRLFARPLAVLTLGVAIAASLQPAVAWLEQAMPRVAAIVVVYLILILLLVSVGWLAAPRFATQLQAFMNNVPHLYERVRDLFSTWMPERGITLSQTLVSLIDDLGLNLFSLPLTVGQSVVQLFLVLFVSFYALIVVPKLRHFLISLVPTHRHADAQALLGELSDAMGGYFRGVALGGLVVGIFTFIGLYFLGVNYPVLLAIFAGVMEFVPILGTLISSFVIVAVAFLQSPHLGLLTLIFVLVLQQVEGNVIFPTVISSQTHVSPLLSLFAFFAGGVVGGVLGALVAIPLAAALRVIVVDVVAPMVRRWTGAARSSATAIETRGTRD